MTFAPSGSILNSAARALPLSGTGFVIAASLGLRFNLGRVLDRSGWRAAKWTEFDRPDTERPFGLGTGTYAASSGVPFSL